MNFRITIQNKNKNKNESFINDHPIIFQNNHVLIQADCLKIKWKNKDDESFFLIGDILGHRKDFKINSKFDNYALLEDSINISEFEGRFTIVKISQDKDVSIWTDTFGRMNVYWCKDEKSNYYITSSKEMIPPNVDLGNIDQNALAQLLTIYGSRPLKKHTLREKLKRLGVGEILTIKDQKLLIESNEFIPKNIFPKDDAKKLDQYAELFIEAVRARASETQNIVYLSSGWDSTSILATLCHLFDKSKIVCIIGRMKYSKRSDVINQFELDRAKKMADYYGVKLYVVEFDYTKGLDEILDDSSNTLRAMEFSNLTGFNHWILAKEAAKIAKSGAAVFAGEISDGAHNFGFSQYFSIYHPASHAFREYSDKMASYLFGPTFLNQLIEGKHEQDPVW
ncbi:MAG: asparagine synthase-related protein, partial [Flavobacteriaceae bacterium]